MDRKELEEKLQGSDKIIKKIPSLFHWHHKRPMIVIENISFENTSEFYVCSDKDCNHKEISYFAKFIGKPFSGIKEHMIYRGFIRYQ